MIQRLVEKNLGEIFPGLEFVKSEYELDDLRPDTIAFDREAKSFVIIEYKNVKNKSVVDQGISYYQLLQEKKEAFVLLYNRIKGKLYEVNEINWDETRVLFISPSFTAHQRRASGFSGAPIELYEIKKFGDNFYTLTKVEDVGKEAGSKVQSVMKKGRTSPIKEYDEEAYLDGQYEAPKPTPEVRELYLKLKKTILDTFQNLETKQRTAYHGIYSKEDGRAVCTLEVRKTKVILTYSTSNQKVVQPSEFVRDVSNIGHWGIGSFESQIKTESDIARAIPLIRKVYERRSG